MLIYVDDILIMGTNIHFISSPLNRMSAQFSIKNLGPLKFFLGISVTRSHFGMFLSQKQYALELLKHADMDTCSSCNTPSSIPKSSSTPDTTLFHDHTFYQSIISGLQYLTFTHPYIVYAVNPAFQTMHAHNVKFCFTQAPFEIS